MPLPAAVLLTASHHARRYAKRAFCWKQCGFMFHGNIQSASSDKTYNESGLHFILVLSPVPEAHDARTVLLLSSRGA